jgi:hypothetical protein
MKVSESIMVLYINDYHDDDDDDYYMFVDQCMDGCMYGCLFVNINAYAFL